jgi:uncharacterized protein YndB with AHSA1/START domain
MRNYWLHMTEEAPSMVPEHIEREILIDAPQDLVWAVITESEHVAEWFGDAAEIDLRPGGDASLTWESYGTFRARVEKVEPPRAFSFRWARPADAEVRDGNSTLVEFTLEPEGRRTRLRVVESGFAELEGTDEEKATHAGENRRGWEIELGELAEYAATRAEVSARR